MKLFVRTHAAEHSARTPCLSPTAHSASESLHPPHPPQNFVILNEVKAPCISPLLVLGLRTLKPGIRTEPPAIKGALALACVLLAVLTSASAQAPPSPRLYRIAGTVTDSITNKPLPKTTLTLLGPGERQTIQTTTADAEGHFELDPVPAAKYSLMAARRGYLAAAFDQHEQYSSAIVTGEDQDTEHIPFRLSQGATVRGVIADENGEPVPWAKVLLVRRTKEGGLGEHLVQSIVGTTEEDGLFEFWDLVPGTYYLAVKADPWFAVHPSAIGPAAAETGQKAEELDVAYPLTFYGGTTEEAAATPIEVAAAARVEADVTLHAVPALRLTVRSEPRKPAEPGSFWPSLSQTVFGDQVIWSGFPRYSENPKTVAVDGDAEARKAELASPEIVKFVGLTPGHYTMSSRGSRFMKIDLTSDEEVETSSASPLYNVELRSRMVDGSALPLSLELSLAADGPQTTQAAFTCPAQEGAWCYMVPAGKWKVQALGAPVALGVVSVQVGAAGLPANEIVVKDRPISATAILAEGKTSIEGFAKKNGKGEPGVMIVLVPRNPAAGVEFFRRDQSDSDGSFALPNVVPGDYTILALEDGWNVEWARPEAISRYLQGGTPISVTAKSGPSIHLREPVAVQAP